MANEAFALSPISARAAEPNEADYDAIREAFMETARGRWFLGEYAKRNRNADTSMVLDAVARIEETLAAQRQPVIEDRLPEALVAIRRALADAESAAGAAFNRAALETSLGPIRRGVRIIKEISWRWREIGADGRICDLIDSQLTAIEGACGQISATDPGAELKGAFDLLRDRIEQTGAGEAAAARATANASAAPMSEAPEIALTDEMVEVAGESELAELPDTRRAIEHSVTITDAVAECVDEPSLDAAAAAEDEAVLDMVALEMAAPDPEIDEAIVARVAAEIAEPAVASARIQEPNQPIAAESGASLSNAMALAGVGFAALERPASALGETAPVPTSSPLPEPSLGSTILASGMLKKPRAANDPLAPIRRMTQAEKIAFFS